MSTVIEYTIRTKPGQYDAVVAAYVRFADRFGEVNPTENLILVTGDRDNDLIRGIGVFGSKLEAEDVAGAGIFADFREHVADFIIGQPERVELELVHSFSK